MQVGKIQNRAQIINLSKRWNILPFVEVLKDSSGGNYKVKKSDYLANGDLAVVDQGKEMIAGYTNNTNFKVKARFPLIVFGDHTRILKYIDFPFAMGADGTKVLEVINKDCDSKFLYYYLSSLDIIDTGYNRHFKYIKDLVFPLPPLKTQKQIACILDNAQALKHKTEELLKEYDQLAQSIFLDIMQNSKGKEYTLSEVVDLNPKKNEIKDLSKSMLITFLSMSAVSESGEIDLSVEKTIEESWSGYTYFRENDVLFAKITPCMENGKGCIAKGLRNNIGFGSTEFHVLRPHSKTLNSEWLQYLLRSKSFREIAEVNMRGSAGQKRVPSDFFDRFKTVIPTLNVQNQFAEKIKLIDQQKELARQELKESQDLFQALLQKAFKGELV